MRPRRASAQRAAATIHAVANGIDVEIEEPAVEHHPVAVDRRRRRTPEEAENARRGPADVQDAIAMPKKRFRGAQQPDESHQVPDPEEVAAGDPEMDEECLAPLPTRAARLKGSQTGSRFGAAIPRHLIAYDIASFVSDIRTLAALSATDMEIRQMMVATQRCVPIWANALRDVRYQQGEACNVFALTAQYIKGSCPMVHFERRRRRGYSWKYTYVRALSRCRAGTPALIQAVREVADMRSIGTPAQTCYMRPSRRGQRRTTTCAGLKCCSPFGMRAVIAQLGERSSPAW